MNSQERLTDIKRRLSNAYGARLQGVVLYGSEALGTARPDSDVDILILLKGPVRMWSDLQTALRTLYPLSLEWGRAVSPKPVDAAEYEAGRYPLYTRAKSEGLRL
jgi:predicted nucleotidyltransferase